MVCVEALAWVLCRGATWSLFPLFRQTVVFQQCAHEHDQDQDYDDQEEVEEEERKRKVDMEVKMTKMKMTPIE